MPMTSANDILGSDFDIAYPARIHGGKRFDSNPMTKIVSFCIKWGITLVVKYIMIWFAGYFPVFSPQLNVSCPGHPDGNVP